MAIDQAAVLSKAGIITERVLDTITAARGAGVELAKLGALLQMESNGRNVFGSDRVPTGGAYTMGGAVTEQTYRAYAKWRDQVPNGAGRCQGVGPLQLTSIDYQRQADRLGGCWRWDINVKVGLDVFTAHERRFGNTRDAFVAYNGGAGAVINRAKKRNDAAEAYGDKAMTRLAALRKALDDGPAAPAGEPWLALPTLKYGDESPAVGALQRWLNAYPWSPPLPLLPITNRFLDQTAKVLAAAQAQMGIKGSDGRDFGPQSKRESWARKFRG